MATRHLYLARHGAADPFGELIDAGRRQADLLGQRFAGLPIDAVWHSPLPRAVATAHELAPHLPGVPVASADELIDHIPYVPERSEVPPSQIGFFDGYEGDEVESGHRLAASLVARFAHPPEADGGDVHEVLITHAYQVAWLVRHALDAPPARWLGLDSANTALTTIQYRTGIPPTLLMFNDLSHLPPELRWTGVRDAETRP